jgi:hypothetical protein
MRQRQVRVDFGVGSDHMLLGQDVVESEGLDPFAVRGLVPDVGADLRLRQHHADLYG